MEGDFLLCGNLGVGGIYISSAELMNFYVFKMDVLYKILSIDEFETFFKKLRNRINTEIASYEFVYKRTGACKKFVYNGSDIELDLRSSEGLKIASWISIFSLLEKIRLADGILYILNRDMLNSYSREEILPILKRKIAATATEICSAINELHEEYDGVRKSSYEELILGLDYMKENHLITQQSDGKYQLSYVGHLFTFRYS